MVSDEGRGIQDPLTELEKLSNHCAAFTSMFTLWEVLFILVAYSTSGPRVDRSIAPATPGAGTQIINPGDIAFNSEGEYSTLGTLLSEKKK